MYVLTPPTYKVQKHQHICVLLNIRVKGNYPGNQRQYLYPFENYPLRKLITFTLQGNSSHYLYPLRKILTFYTLTFTFTLPRPKRNLK
jgi:hypothetical protein